MVKKRSEKQLAVLSRGNVARWGSKVTGKQNTLHANSSRLPRTVTRAGAYVQCLERTVEEQNTRILSAEQSTHALQSQNLTLANKLHDAHSRIHSLEESQIATTTQLSSLQNNLSLAHSTIDEQSSIINQKTQRINRLMRDKSALANKIAQTKQELLQAVLSAEEARRESKKISVETTNHIESLLLTVSRLTAATSHLKSDKTDLLADLKATRLREGRAKTTAQKLRQELAAKSKWSGMKGRMYHSQYRTLVMAFSKAGCAQSRIGSLLARVGKVFGVNLKRSMSRRTVGRVITEAGIKVRIQLGHEMARAKALCMSSDGTSHRNIKYEARHITYKAPTYSDDPDAPTEAFATRVVEVDHALDHTAQTQFEGWDSSNAKIIDAYANSPLACRDALEGISYDKDDLYRKALAYHSDHAADVHLAAQKFKEKKQLVVETDLGREEIRNMSDEDLETLLWSVLYEICEDPDALDPNALPEDLRCEAVDALAAKLGAEKLDSLPQERRQLLTRFVIAGCWMHKDHNCTKFGVVGLQKVWDELGITPPVLLANKDNAATIALGEEGDSAAVERALKTSHRGGHKLISICGNLFRHKDDKKGHQDLHRHYFTQVTLSATGKATTVKFPDTSNNRYGTHLSGAVEIFVYRSSYMTFMHIIRDTKSTPGLNHSEQNALMGLENEETMEELLVMVVYKNTVSDSVIKIVRAPGVNHLDLAYLPNKIIAHLEKLIANTDLVFDPTSHGEEATLDGSPFPDPYAMDSVHFWLESHKSRIPIIEKLLIGFLKGSLTAWKRFTTYDYADGGDLDSLTSEEKQDLSIPTTNDCNESLLGGLRDYSRVRGGTVHHYTAQVAYHRNNTEAFAAAKLGTEEDALYIMRLARMQDASGDMRRFREELLEFKDRVAEDARKKRVEKEAEVAAETARLTSIKILTSESDLQALPVKKGKNGGGGCLRDQLDVRRDLWKDEILVKTKLKDISKKADMVAAIMAADKRRTTQKSTDSSPVDTVSSSTST